MQLYHQPRCPDKSHFVSSLKISDTVLYRHGCRLFHQIICIYLTFSLHSNNKKMCPKKDTSKKDSQLSKTWGRFETTEKVGVCNTNFEAPFNDCRISMGSHIIYSFLDFFSGLEPSPVSPCKSKNILSISKHSICDPGTPSQKCRQKILPSASGKQSVTSCCFPSVIYFLQINTCLFQPFGGRSLSLYHPGCSHPGASSEIYKDLMDVEVHPTGTDGRNTRGLGSQRSRL